MAKADWRKLRTEYIADHSASYRSLAKKYGLSESVVGKKGVAEGWSKMRKETDKKIQQKLPEKMADTILAVNARHAKIGKSLQAMGLEALQTHKPSSNKDARLLIAAGVDIERRAVGTEDTKPVDIQFVVKGVSDKELLEWT